MNTRQSCCPPTPLRALRLLVAGAMVLLAAACAPVTAVDTHGACSLTFEDRGAVRVFAVTHRQRLDDALSNGQFEAAWRRHLAQIVPCLSPHRPNLIVFTEQAGLLAWFIGRQSILARNASGTADAFNALYAQNFRQADAYRQRFPGISAARGLTLALADRGWRAMERTFGGIARETKAWVVTSANLPDVDAVNGGIDPFFRDPDAEGPVYLARSAEVYNQALVYGPDGARVASVKKVFLTPPEEDLLDLSNGRLDELKAVQLPFANLGIAISRDAWYPPFVQRLEDVDAQLFVQPEAFGGWSQPEQSDWLPDVITAAGWSANQKYAGFRYSVAGMLTGNLLSETFDGQSWVSEKATPAMPPRGFVASRPQPGFAAIGPWAFAEPDTSLPLEQRQAAVRRLGLALLPGSGSRHEGEMADGVIGKDLVLDPSPIAVVESQSHEVLASPGEQRGGALAYDADGRLYLAFSDSSVGPRMVLGSSSDDGVTWVTSQVEPRGTTAQRRAALAVSAGRVALVWQESHGANDRVRLAVSGDAGKSFALSWLEEGSDLAQWEPAVALHPDGRVVVAFTDFRDGPSAHVRVKCGAAASVPVDDTAFASPRRLSSQAQPTLARASDGTLALAWLDYREGDWQVYARVGDVCATGPGRRVSPDAQAEVLAADPHLSPAGAGFALGWDEIRHRRANRSLGVATFSAGAWTVVADPTPDTVSRFRPVGVQLGSTVQWIAQDLGPGKNALVQFTRPEGPFLRWDATGDSPNQLVRPVAAARPDGTRGAVCFEDDRSGRFHLRCGALAGMP